MLANAKNGAKVKRFEEVMDNWCSTLRSVIIDSRAVNPDLDNLGPVGFSSRSYLTCA